MINQDKPSTVVSNSPKISFGETWDTWDVAWEDETRTWDELGKLIDNSSKPTVASTYLLQENGFYLLQENGGKLTLEIMGRITNIDKPHG